MGGLSLLKKSVLSAAAAAMVLGASAPAFAGGGHYRHGYHHGYHGHHGHYRRGGGGKGAAIALGVIGGAIILNELAEDRARDRYYQDRYYQDRYYYDQRSQTRAYDRGYYDGRDDQRRADDYYDNRAYDDGAYDDSGLAGGGPVYRSPGASDYDRAPRMVSESAAYNACLSHARRALAERGFVVSAPYRPETVEDRGGALLMTATVTAERGADMWSRAMSCEASESRVYRMELI